MKTLSLFAVALLATTALLSAGCSEPQPATTPPAAGTDAGGSGDKEKAAGSSTSSTTLGNPELTTVSFDVKGMT